MPALISTSKEQMSVLISTSKGQKMPALISTSKGQKMPALISTSKGQKMPANALIWFARNTSMNVFNFIPTYI